MLNPKFPSVSVYEARCLGVILDAHLKSGPHIYSVTKKKANFVQIFIRSKEISISNALKF